MEVERWAAAYYRVEREWTGSVLRKRQRKKATEQAIEHGDPVPELPSDVVRIYDREGSCVFEQNWGDRRSDAMAHEARIVEDLLKLDVANFEAKYGIAVDSVLPPAPAAEGNRFSLPFDGVRRESDEEPGEEPGALGRPEQGSG